MHSTSRLLLEVVLMVCMTRLDMDEPPNPIPNPDDPRVFTGSTRGGGKEVKR